MKNMRVFLGMIMCMLVAAVLILALWALITLGTLLVQRLGVVGYVLIFAWAMLSVLLFTLVSHDY